MFIAPQLTAEEFRDVHNGKCRLYSAVQSLDGVIAEQHLKTLQEALDLINKGLRGAYEQEEVEYQKASNLHERLAEENGLRSLWSIYEVKDFSAAPFPEARALIYKQHWGEKPVDVLLPENATWLDLWKAANDLIFRSGDLHHVFIEDISPTKENSFILELSTGS